MGIPPRSVRRKPAGADRGPIRNVRSASGRNMRWRFISVKQQDPRAARRPSSHYDPPLRPRRHWPPVQDDSPAIGQRARRSTRRGVGTISDAGEAYGVRAPAIAGVEYGIAWRTGGVAHRSRERRDEARVPDAARARPGERATWAAGCSGARRGGDEAAPPTRRPSATSHGSRAIRAGVRGCAT